MGKEVLKRLKKKKSKAHKTKSSSGRWDAAPQFSKGFLFPSIYCLNRVFLGGKLCWFESNQWRN